MSLFERRVVRHPLMRLASSLQEQMVRKDSDRCQRGVGVLQCSVLGSRPNPPPSILNSDVMCLRRLKPCVRMCKP